MRLQPIASNMTQVDFSNGYQVLFPYKTPVACLSDNGYYRTSKFWSVTTSRHINKWLGSVNNVTEIDQTVLDNLAA